MEAVNSLIANDGDVEDIQNHVQHISTQVDKVFH